MERIMGFAAGSGSVRDKLAGAVAAPRGVFPQAQQGGHILNPCQKQVALGTNEITPFLISLLEPMVFSD